jgi:hypothetical protein
LPRIASSLVRALAVTLGLAFLLVLAIFPLRLFMMNWNLGGRAMIIGPSMFPVMFWASLVFTLIAVAVGVIGYNVLLPKINPTPMNERAPVDYRDAVLRLLKDDERQVVEALAKSGGVAYQRDLQHTIGFSKVKTHRVIARLAERRLLDVTPAGKTNQIRIPSWLVGERRPTESHQEMTCLSLNERLKEK